MSILREFSTLSKSSWTSNNLFKGKKLRTKDVRRLSLHDVPRIVALKNKITDAMFGEDDIYDIVYNSYITYGVEDEGELVGAICLSNHPNLKCVPPCSWEQWAKVKFDLDVLTALNTQWIHILAFNIRNIGQYLRPMVEVIFSENRNLKYICVVVPPGIKLLTFLTDYSSRVSPTGYRSAEAVTTCGLLTRKDFFHEYKIRKAVEEDNDDIIALIEANSPKFKKLYGEYYISELLSRVKRSPRHIIVAEYKGYAVAVMIINETVNYNVLNEAFEVGPFHGFRRPHDEDEYPSLFNNAHEDSILDLDESDNTSSESISGFSKGSSDSAAELKKSRLDEEDVEDEEDIWSIDSSFDLSALSLSHDDNIKDLSAYYGMEGSRTSILSTCMLNTGDLGQETAQFGRSRSSSLTELKEIRQEIMKKYMYTPTFLGKEDAFAMEILVSQPQHIYVTELLLQAAFECIQKKNYFLLSAPSAEILNPLIRQFVRVTPRRYSIFPHELYLLHRNAINPELIVRQATKEDIPFVEEFLSQMKKLQNAHDKYINRIEEEDDESNFTTLIMSCEKQIIGLAVLSDEVDLDYLYAHYKLYQWLDEEKHKLGDVGLLECLLIYPIFQKYCKFFLEEIHRLADFSLLVYLVTPQDLDTGIIGIPFINCIHHLVPISPRPMQEYDPQFIEEAYYPPKFVTEANETLSLFISMNRFLGVRSIEINTRIVVVGAGDTAMAFLETLVTGSGPNLLVTFNNVTVVSPQGLPYFGEKSKSKNIYTFNRAENKFYHKVLHMNLRIYVNSVCGVLTRIKRKNKYIVVDALTQIPYDYLVLFCGAQYRLPKVEYKTKRKTNEFPQNAFMINTDADANQVFTKLSKEKKLFNKKEYMGQDFVIIYGKDVNALMCLGTLIEIGVPANAIALINPHDTLHFSSEASKSLNLVFSDPEVSEAVDQIIENLGVKMYRDFKMDSWDITSDNKVRKIEISSKISTLQIGCKYIFIYAEKSISNKTYKAIYKSGLVFDGRVVINAKFRTNDPYVFAAGPFTQYSRKYHAEHKSHVYYNSQEVGETIGRQFRKMLIPEKLRTLDQQTIPKEFPDSITTITEKLPVFRKPLVVYCLLPGSIFYLSVAAPGKPVPVELMMTSDEYGKLLVTGDQDNLEKQGYFRLHINRGQTVESISCLTKEPMDVSNLVSIWGKHVTLLNELVLRFETGGINDLFEFFKEPCMSGIVHDKFPSLMADIRELILKTQVEDDKTVPELLMGLFENNHWNLLTDRETNEITHLVKDSTLIHEIEDKVMEFVQKNSTDLPMYAYTYLIQQILQSYKKSPMFTK